MSFSPFPGPIAPENNPPIQPQFFQPSRFVISNITLGATTTVTTEVNHNYVIGQLTRLLIPFTFGSVQLNEQTGYVINIPAQNQVVLDLNSLDSNAFVASPSYGPTAPQIIAVGDTNSGFINASGRSPVSTLVPGSFQNISPQ